MTRSTENRLSCREVMRVLHAFLDGEITSQRAELVAAHLDSCTRCGVEADVLERVITQIRSLRPDLDLAAYSRLVDAIDRLADDDPS